VQRCEQPGRLPQAPFGAVAHHRPADAARGGKADANEIVAVAASTRLGGERALSAASGLGRGEKVATLLQAFDADQAVRRLRPRARRRAISLRPLRVAIRERKPWRRLRTSRDG
jgi:hypothetical protein